MSQRREQPAQGAGFAEAVAQWRLQLRTELKRASSLPTSMFDACDPMLETRLCETAESMLQQLTQPDAALASPDQPGEQRIEHVSIDELRRLPLQASRGEAIAAGREAGANGSLDRGLDEEYLAVLADLATVDDTNCRDRAARLLLADCGLGGDGDLDAAARQLWRLLPGGDEPMPGAEDRVAELCRRIAATVLARAAADPGEAAP